MIIFSIIGAHLVLIDITNIRSRKPKNASSTGRRWLAAVIYLSFFFCLYACTTQNYGNLKPSSEITKIFENHQVLSDHLYYYSGLQGVPDAIIAVHPNGNRIGIWFAAQRHTVVRLEQNNRVVISPPDPPKAQRIR